MAFSVHCFYAIGTFVELNAQTISQIKTVAAVSTFRLVLVSLTSFDVDGNALGLLSKHDESFFAN